MFERIKGFIQKKTTKPKVYSEASELSGTHVALLATDGFEESELFVSKEALEHAGAVVHVISLRPGKIKGWKDGNWGKSILVDKTIREAWSMSFDALLLPGGVINPDKLRGDSEAVAFVMSFVNKGLPIGAICHGVQMLIETGSLKGYTLTSWPSLKTDLLNAGAHWVDEEVIESNNLVTSRKPEDLPAFTTALIELLEYASAHRPLPNTEGYVVTL